MLPRKGLTVKRVLVAVMFVLAAFPAVARTHRHVYEQQCSQLWPAVKDVLKISGKYNLISISNEEMSASFQVGAFWTGKTLNSVVLVPNAAGCQMSINTMYRGVEHNDAGDFKQRVDAALAPRSSHGGN
jgi:hypothetical protein